MVCSILLLLLVLQLSSSDNSFHRSTATDDAWRFGIATEMSTARQVVKKILSVEQDEGVGARVRRSVGRPEVRTVQTRPRGLFTANFWVAVEELGSLPVAG